MRKYTLTLLLAIFCNLAFSQYVAFFKFKTDDPATVVATMTDLMNSDYGKTIPAKVNLFGALFNAEDPTTHAVTFDFANENDLNAWLNGWAVSKEAQLYNSKFQTILEDVVVMLVAKIAKGDNKTLFTPPTELSVTFKNVTASPTCS